MFPTSFKLSLFRFGPERGLIVHLVVGIHVANVAVADQVHVTKFLNSTKNGSCFQVASRACYLQIIKSDQILTILSLQFKTGVKSTLTSQIKTLDAINTFGIYKLIKSEPGLNPDRKMRQMRWIGVVGDADNF